MGDLAPTMQGQHRYAWETHLLVSGETMLRTAAKHSKICHAGGEAICPDQLGGDRVQGFGEILKNGLRSIHLQIRGDRRRCARTDLCEYR